MNSDLALALAFGVGIVAGLRTFTAPAALCWAAHLHWLNLQGTHFAFMGSTIALVIFTLAAIGELIADQSANIGKRTAPGPLTGRIVMGALSGATLCAAAGHLFTVGAVLGAIGAVVGCYGGYAARVGLGKSLGVADIVIAIPEDLVAIGLGLFLASRV